ncbi:Rab7a, partial [Symbiodinium necroappetens]
MMSEPDPAGPAQVDLPQVAARLEGYAELTTLQKIIREKLQTPALIEVTVGADLSDRKHRQIQRRRELAKHLGRTSVLFYNGMQDANIAIDEETISVWISRENVEHFALRKAQKKAEMALQQRQGFGTTS